MVKTSVRLLLFVVCSLVLFSGCVGVRQISGVPGEGPGGVPVGEGFVKLAVDWDSLDASAPIRPLSFSASAAGDEITLIGARVVAPNINALLAQSATRQTAATQGIITIPVPATSNANLYAVAIDDDRNVVMLGYLEGIVVPASSVLTISSDELTWIAPDAYLSGTVEWKTPAGVFVEQADPFALATGTITAPDDVAGQGCGVSAECTAIVDVRFTDPFKSSASHPMICMGGIHVSAPCYGSDLPVQGDWAAATLNCYSNHPLACEGRAYVNGPLFSLPQQYGFGPQFGPLTIDWRP